MLYIAIFHGCKNDYLQKKNCDIFLIFAAKIRKNVYPCTPQFYYIKVECKGVYIIRTCLHDEYDSAA